jgi:hypothetical protein
MPAIHPARLKIQAAQLADSFAQPEHFVRQLHDLLELYADRAHRPGQAGEPAPLVTAYKSPPPVLRQVKLELAPRLAEQSTVAAALCDALWAEPYLEFRLLAAWVLSQLPEERLLERLPDWLQAAPGDKLLDAVLEQGLAGLRQTTPDRFLAVVEDWLKSPAPATQQLGLRAILPLLNECPLEALPTLYRLLTPFLRQAPPLVRPDLLAVLSALVRCSPAETAYLLRQNLETPDNPDTAWLIRQVLKEFPPDLQNSLRTALRAA